MAYPTWGILNPTDYVHSTAPVIDPMKSGAFDLLPALLNNFFMALMFFAVSAQARGDATPEDLENAWEEELAKLQEAEVPERELRKVKNRVAADNYRKLESNMSLFIQLAFNEALLDWREINESPKKYEAVSAADIRRVARKYFKPTNRSVALYRRQAD